MGYFLGVQNFEFRYFWRFSEKKNIRLGMRILWMFFWGLHKIGLYLGVFSMHFSVFSYRQGTELGIFFGWLKFGIFFGVLEISDIYFGVNGRCWARASL